MPAVASLTRRAALALGATGAITLTACEPFTSTDGSGDPPDPEPDVALVDETATQIAATAAVASAVPELVAMHAAHLAALEAAPAPSPTPPAGTTTGPEVRQAEQALQAYLVDASMRAQSGALARLLAAMSAAVSQQLVALRRELR